MRRLVLVVVGAWTLLVGAAPAAGADTGPWGWPLDGPREVSRAFAPPETRYGTGHRGADVPSPPGSAVRAAGAGRVSYAGLLAGRGVVVVVHGALRTTYEPVAASVAVGDVVALRAVLGRLEAGHGGCPVAACLHWGLRRGEDYLDPVRLVQAGPVRLLPLDGSPRSGPVGGLRTPSSVPAQQQLRTADERGLSELGPATPASPGPAARPAQDSAGPDSAAPDSPAAEPGAAQGSAVGRWILAGQSLPLTLVAMVALVAGVVLLRRSGPLPRPPLRPGPAAAAPGRAVSPDEATPGSPPPGGHVGPGRGEPWAPTAPLAEVLELEAERLRRRSG